MPIITHEETNKETFEAYMARNASGEPEIEKDTEYTYENYHNAEGEELGFISWHKGEATYTIRNA